MADLTMKEEHGYKCQIFRRDEMASDRWLEVDGDGDDERLEFVTLSHTPPPVTLLSSLKMSKVLHALAQE